MSSYPLTIESETFSISNFMNEGISYLNGETEVPSDNKVKANIDSIKSEELFNSSMIRNDLESFRSYLLDTTNEIHKYIRKDGIVYNYNINFDVYSYDINNTIVNANGTNGSNQTELPTEIASAINGLSSFGISELSFQKNFSEIPFSTSTTPINSIIKDNYNLIYGEWPTSYDELLLVLNDDNSINIEVMYELGFISRFRYNTIVNTIKNGNEYEGSNGDIIPELDYTQICNHEFYLVTPSDHYIKSSNNTYE